ncbi:MAG: glycosyltransferase family 1 protein [Tepidisphaeraceae bacterium]
MNLRYPIYFVHRGLSDWPEMVGGSQWIDPDRCPQRFMAGADHWTIQTFLHLKRRGDPVHLAGEFVPGEINVVYYDDLLLKSRPDRAFIVAIQPDRPRPAACDVRIVQNKLQVRTSNDHHVVFWPQPGLREREPSRKNILRRLGYLGMAVYLGKAFQDEAFRRRLAELDIELVIREKDWTDCSDLDAILAVRRVSPFDLTIKPASKLINAWRAGCPALLGPEPAYRELRKSPLDYFEVQSPDDAIAALRRLRDEPNLMDQMIASGHRRAEEFSVEKIASRWEALLAGPVSDAYERWQRESRLFRTIRFAFRSLEHKRQRRRFFKLIKT